MQTTAELDALIGQADRDLADAERRERDHRDQRIAPLTAGDYAAVEKLEDAIGAEVTRQLHIKERLKVLHRLRDETHAAEQEFELDAPAARADRTRLSGEKVAAFDRNYRGTSGCFATIGVDASCAARKRT